MAFYPASGINDPWELCQADYWPLAHCGDCDRTWTGNAECHCAQCCAHFGSDDAFLRHQTSDGECRPPASVGLTAVERKSGTVWIRANSDGGAFPEALRNARTTRETLFGAVGE